MLPIYSVFRSKPFNTDIQDAFRPVHFVAKLVGIASYTFIRNTRSGEETINISWKYNRSGVIWSLLLLTVGTVAALYEILKNLFEKTSSVPGLLTNSVEIPLVYASGLVPLILGLTTYRTRMLQLITKLSTVDKCLIRPSDDIYKKHKAKILTVLVCFITSIILIYLLFIYYLFFRSGDLFSGIFLGLADFIWLINDLGTVNVVTLLHERLSILNKSIESLFIAQSRGYKAANKSNDFVVKRRRHRVLTAPNLENISVFVAQHSILHSQNIQSSVPPETGTVAEPDYRWNNAEIIVTYRKMYQKLYDICCLINSMCGFSLLLSTLSHACRFVSDVFHAVHLLLMTYSSKERLVPKQEVTLFIIFSLITLVRIMSVTLSCHKTCEECRKCVDGIQELLLRSDQKDIISQLKLFSSQLENNRIEFTACGLFAVNLSLLTTLTGVTVTYIVLLIQM
jgi:hypothetical protein